MKFLNGILKLKQLLLYAFSLISCGKANDYTNNHIDLANPKKEVFYISNVSNDITYIPLEDSIPIKFINRVHYDDSLLFCHASPEGILMFNSQGRFIRRIGRIGRGPGEYLNGINFTVDKERDYLYVNNQSILKYSYDGRYWGKIAPKIEVPLGRISYANNYIVSSYHMETSPNKTPYQWLVIDTLGNIVSEKDNNSFFFDKVAPTFVGDLTYSFGNKIHYWNHYNDTIFGIEPQGQKSKYILSKEDFKLTTDVMSNFKGFDATKDYIIIKRILESKPFILVMYDLHKSRRIVLYDKSSKASYELKGGDGIQSSFINDIDGGLNFVPFKILNDSIMIASIDAYQLKTHIASVAFKNSKPLYPEKKKELEKLANSLDENDNPVLMLVKLKE